MREYQDEQDEMQQMLDESDSEEERNWISEPNSPRSKEALFNPQFNKRVNELSKAY